MLKLKHYLNFVSDRLSIPVCITALSLICLLGCSEPSVKVTANKQYRLSEQYILAGELSPGAKLTALVTVDNKLTLWRNQDISTLRSWDLSQVDAAHLTFSADQQFLALGSSTSLLLFDIASGDKQELWTTHGMPEGTQIDAVAISETGTTVIAGLNHGGIVVIELDNQLAYRVEQNFGSVVEPVFVNGDRQLLFGSTKGKVMLMSLDTKEAIQLIETEHRITSLVAQRGKLFISDALAQQQIMEYTSNAQPLQLEYSDRWRWFRHGVFLEDQRYLVTSSPKSELSLWSTDNGTELARWQIHRVRPGATTLALEKMDSGELVSLTSDGVLQVWPKVHKIRTTKYPR